MLFNQYLNKVAELVRRKAELSGTLKQATDEFKELNDLTLPRRPLVGINGEIYLRSNRFSNKDLVNVCEASGLEVVVSPVGEWLKYIVHRNLEDAVKDRKYKKIIYSYLRKRILEHDERVLVSNYAKVIEKPDPSTKELLSVSSDYLSSNCGSEAVLSIGSGIDWLENPEFAGVISVMPHGCMPGGIVAAMAEKLSRDYQKPWINLTYDGFLETNNSTRIAEFAELVILQPDRAGNQD
jgi:predicted nucleotide-binding protein (sugar kinase/HSP70/actin superfamily)